MHTAQLIQYLFEISTIILLLLPIAILLNLLKKSKGDIPRSFTWLTLGFTPFLAFNLIDSLAVFGIELLPDEGTLSNVLLYHSVILITIITVAAFFLWFDRKYVQPIYSFTKTQDKKVKKKIFSPPPKKKLFF
ncbi:hypothetical protein HYV79_01750 [Candidatus Woesearchaeota archaeon]|nr:hypothetical protein [Candidatus Woesearchaeota archaeon]